MAHAFTIKPVVYGSLVVAWRSLRRAATPRLLITNLTGLGYLFSDAPPARVVRVGLWPLLVGFGQGLVVGWRQRRRRAGGVLVGPLRWPAAGAVRRAAAGQQGGG